MPQIAGYELYAIEAGRFGLDGGAMFGVVPKILWERRIKADERNRIPMAMRCLLLAGNGRVILIDTGAGTKYDEKFADIYAIEDQHANLEKSLREVGVRTEDVTDVILTHLHFDHCGGATKRTGNRLFLMFPNAVHHIQQSHWEWAMDPNPRERASFLKENLDPLAASKQVHLAEGGGTILPGVDVRVVDGHTIGQQIVRIFDNGTVLLYVADLIPTIHHLPIPWVMGYDIQPLKSMSEKEAILDEACDNGWQLFFEHDADVELGRAVRTEKGYGLEDARPLAEL